MHVHVHVVSGDFDGGAEKGSGSAGTGESKTAGERVLLSWRAQYHVSMLYMKLYMYIYMYVLCMHDMYNVQGYYNHIGSRYAYTCTTMYN